MSNPDKSLNEGTKKREVRETIGNSSVRAIANHGLKDYVNRGEVDSHDGHYGIYFGNKLNKQDHDKNVVNRRKPESTIFEGCSIYVNGATTVPREQLEIIFLRNGGNVKTFDKSTDAFPVTHYVCDNLPPCLFGGWVPNRPSQPISHLIY